MTPYGDALVILSVFGGITAVLVAPVAVLIGLPLAAWLARAWLSIQERELRLREYRLVLEMRETNAIPTWVDQRDPKAMLAWMRTDRELAALEPGRRGGTELLQAAT